MMNQLRPSCEITRQKTLAAFMWMKVLDTPFWAIFNLLPFILYKDLHATPLQITAIIVLKPAVSLVALYWSALIEKRRDRLIPNLVWARVLGVIPFLFFPIFENTWHFIIAFGFYMMLARGTVPAWMEVLKLNIPGVSRELTYAYGSAFGYFGGAVIPIALGTIMDSYPQSWKWIFPITASISLSAVFFKLRIPIDNQDLDRDNFAASLPLSLFQQLVKPWKSAWELIIRRFDFAYYQLAFALGGAGLAIMQPVLPAFFTDNLNLSYTELALAVALCKGIGFAITSPMWARLMHKITIFHFNGLAYALGVLFPLTLIIAQFNMAWLYGGYFIYGIMQAGNEMSWSLSGPIFAEKEDSSVYTSVNILTVGLRGCVVPIIGGVLGFIMQSTGIMIIGSVLCLLSTISMSMYRQPKQKSQREEAISS